MMLILLRIPWDKLVSWTFWSTFWMDHKKHMRKSSAKVSTINMVVTVRLWRVNVHAL